MASWAHVNGDAKVRWYDSAEKEWFSANADPKVEPLLDANDASSGAKTTDEKAVAVTPERCEKDVSVYNFGERLGDDMEPDEESLLGRNERENILEPGAKIRQEAREELQRVNNSSTRPSKENLQVVDLGKHNGLSSPENKSQNPTNDGNVGSRRRTANRKSLKDDKRVHHVQFNKDLKDSENPPSTPSASISTSSSSSSEDNSSLGCQFSEARPPDGGWGWVVVAASFMVNLIADGITFSFGVIYVAFLNDFKEGKSKTAWIGSLFMAMPLLSGPVASFLTDRYGCRRVSIAGSILATAGFIVSSFTASMEVLIFTFGVVSGFGLSLCYVAAVVIVAYYFDKRRSFATGLSVCGSGIGTFIFAPLTHYLENKYGWRGTIRILAGLFLNLAVCGCLMRDLEWTTTRVRAKTEERRRNRVKKRTKVQSSSADSFSASSSANTTTQTPHDLKRSFASANAMVVDNSREKRGKLYSSLVSLPTFVKNGEEVPPEVLELLSTHKNVYNVLVQNYPSLLISSRSFSESGALHDQLSVLPIKLVPAQSSTIENRLAESSQAQDQQKQVKQQQQHTDAAYIWWLKKTQPDFQLQRGANVDHHRRFPTAYLKDIRVHRHSLTYRGAMLNINRYRLRASSCPDIYRNSMTTIAKTKLVWYAGIWDFWDLLVDMLDFSYFADSRFLLFAMSNFLLYTWYDVPYVYLTDNAIEMGFSDTDASILISVIGIANMGGEIVLGWAGDKAWVNASMVYAGCMALCGAATALIPMVDASYRMLCVISGAFGLFIAANYSLTSIILVELITLDRFTNAYGLLLLVQGIANLVGPPLAGWLYDITGTYNLSFYLAGLFIALSGGLLVVMPIIEKYRKWRTESDAEITGEDFTNLETV